MKKIGIFGGTLNSPHSGHLVVAESVCDQLNLENGSLCHTSLRIRKRRR